MKTTSDRRCADCSKRTEDYQWCDTCAKYVCDECGDSHDCLTKILDRGDSDDASS